MNCPAINLLCDAVSSVNVYPAGYNGGGLDGKTSAGSGDLLVVKYGSGGIKQWTQQLGNSSYDHGNGITRDSSGNVYVTGLYSWWS